MKRECECQLHCGHRKSEGKLATSVLFPGILLTCLEGDSAEPFGTPDYVLQIRCCRQGRVGWRFPDGRELCLGKGDLAIHTVETWKGSERFLPEDGGCDGFCLTGSVRAAGCRCRKAVIGRRASLPGFIRGRMATAPAGSG